MTHVIKQEDLDKLDSTILLAYLLSCHKCDNFEGRALVRAQLLRQGTEVPIMFFDIQAGYFYPAWIAWSEGDKTCPYCSSESVGQQERNNIDSGNVRNSRRICYTCGSHGPAQLC